MSDAQEARGTRRRVLIVDDEAAIRNLLRLFFERQGYEIEIAENGQKALERFEVDRFHCVILAYYIPIMNGLEVASEMRRRDANAPILLMSARAHALSEREVATAGVTKLLPKPFDLNELSEWVRSLPRLSRRTPSSSP